MKNPSYTYKRTTDNLSVRNPTNCRYETDLRTHPGFKKMFVETAACLLADAKLSPTEKLVFLGVKLFIWYQDGKCTATHEAIASLCNVSVRTVDRALLRLCKEGGRLKAQKNPNRSVADTLTEAAPERLIRCRDCGLHRPLNSAEICVVCRKRAAADHEVRDWFDQNGPAALTIIWADLKAHGSKSSSKDIQRAYNRLVA